ncbi:MAG TPA: sulfatase-like hydrolase/transferase, partial [Polyangiaceae bacterium]|nr:sulfatase-like hydrolase/transferase [Polyangiaceae bacterium]
MSSTTTDRSAVHPGLGRPFDVTLATLLAGLLVALLDGALWAQSPAGPLAIYSLVAIYALPMALAVGVASWVLGSAAQLKQRLAAESSWLWPCCAVAWLGWLVVNAQLSVWCLSSLSAMRASAVMTLGLIAITGLCWVSAFAAARSLQRSLGNRFTPRIGLLLALIVAALGMALLIAVGETSGAGGALPLFGVMRRQELDLRAASLLLVWLIAGWSLLELRVRRARPLWLAALAIALLVLTAGYGYTRWNDAVAFSVRSSAPLGGKLLGPLWKVTDRDRDGQSALFAGGDCNDSNDAIYSGAQEEPGNLIDEDWSGSDEQVIAIPEGKSPIAAMGGAPGSEPVDLRKDLNLLFITVDTMRYDLGYMGNPRPLSKNMDQLASRSVVFERAYSVASYTGKAIGPILIGRYPSENHRTFAHFDRFSKDNVFLQERLQKAGLRTVSVQGYWYFVEDKSGLIRGFDVVDQTAKPPTVKIEGDATVNSDKISDAALKQLQAVQDQRFFMWVHYVDPHADYVPHEGFDFGSKGRERYDGEIAFVDQQLGR